ncbi:MAG TPA: FHA domain-containing protein [Blastocatellia bacterium]|nr:FHA domain-containing protein [Blastocatellia bacterium]
MNQQDNKAILPKAYLIGATGALANHRFALQSERVVIGRDPSQCQIVLENPMVSKRHAMIEVNNHQATIIDLDSRNGTFVNGVQIKRRDLRDGDTVSFGPGGQVALTFRIAEGAQPAELTNPQPIAPPFKRETPNPVRPVQTPTAPSPSYAAADSMLRAADKPVIRIGRAHDNDVVLDAPGVSRYHAMLTYTGPQPVITDLGSTNGTFVNGEPLTGPRLLGPGDMISLGGFLLRVEGRNIRRVDLSASRISAWNVTKIIEGKPIIRDISLALWPREFVGLMGPSGCGKSTLMDALNGLRPATHGAVYVNELDLYRNFDALRRSIGHVPQKDILHDTLTVERTLYYAAKLRLPEGTPKEQIQRVVMETIQTVGLMEQRNTQFRQLSGGQQKRLSLAIELLTKPSFIFLDEPTSPLDPRTTESMMMLFRRLADEGRIVVMVTHKFEKFEEMHHVAILTEGGRLAFFGPPREALIYFGCNTPSEIYHRIENRNPDELSNLFKQSSQYSQYVSERVAEAQEIVRTRPHDARTYAQRGTEREFGISQWVTLTRRYLEVKLKDSRNTALLLLQSPLIALMVALILGGSLNDPKTLFISAVVSIWFGGNNAIREIVAETDIYMRERLVNLKIPSYVFSKFFVLGAIAFIQTLLFVIILVAFGRLNSADFLILMLILYLTALGGISLGLFFSALVKSTEKAMTVLPLILIPQLLLSGFFKPLSDIYIKPGNPPRAVTAREFQDAGGEDNPNNPIIKNGGLGAASVATWPILARWSVEGLVHAVSLSDDKTRIVLPTKLTVAEYDPEKDEQNTTAYALHLLMDIIILTIFIAVFLIFTMWALKRKDVL